jgi:hypothetical protein
MENEPTERLRFRSPVASSDKGERMPLPACVDAIDWTAVRAALDTQGWAVVPGLLDEEEAKSIAGLYARDEGFRSRVVMARHGFGRGEYRYFSYPLPDPIAAIRTAAYPHLVPIANDWHARMKRDDRFPPDHAAFLARCHAAGQVRPTPLLLEYGPGDHNCLHRDIYGDHVFPIQMALLLDQPGRDFEGGEFVMTEQRPRMQSRAMVLPLRMGDVALFAVNSGPVRGGRGDYQVRLNHGVSRVTAGSRHVAGIIFHDAS